MAFLSLFHRVADRVNLTQAEAREAMLAILEGEVSVPLIASFAVALRMKGETADEILGFATAMREKASRVEVGLANGEPLLDTCGTGGDGGGTFNISTVAAFVAAGAGVHVAKHGNRSLASQCGSADVLEELGVNIAMTPAAAARAIREARIGFLFAPAIHPAMKHAQPARAELKMRTAFNLLGPLSNPAGATAQLIGAPSERAAELMAAAIARLGVRRAFVVHGSDGLDEITTTAETHVWDAQDGNVRRFIVQPEDFGVVRVAAQALRGGDRQRNAGIAREVLAGKPGPARDIVLINAAAALVAAEMATDFREAMTFAAQAIDSGAADSALRTLAALQS